MHEYECRYTVTYPAGPRATPLVNEGKVYTLGAEGNLFCLDAATGKVVWSRAFKKDYGVGAPLWGFAGHPLVEGNKLLPSPLTTARCGGPTLASSRTARCSFSPTNRGT